jgi:hypothetical protein
MEKNETMLPSSGIDEQLNAAKAKRSRQFIVAGLIVTLLLIAVMGLVFWQPTNQQQNANIPMPQSPLAAEISDEIKQQMQEKLMETQQQIDALRTNAGFVSWAGKRFLQLEQTLKLSFEDYCQGNFVALSSNFDVLTRSIETLTKDYVASYSNWMQQANEAFAQNQYAKAEGLAKKVLLLNPTIAEASVLLSRIKVMPDVLKLIEQFKGAEASGDVNAQLFAVDAILALDPNNEFASQRRTGLVKQTQQTNAEVLLSELNQAIEQVDIARAEQLLSQLKASGQLTQSNQRLLATLDGKVQQLKQTMQQEALQETLHKLAQQDSWPEVQSLSKLATTRFPHYNAFQTLSQDAAEIVRLQNKLSGYLARPERLSDETIRNNANLALQQAKRWFAKSPSMEQQAKQLESTIVAKQTKIRVIVNSDARSSLRILGVGELGEFQQRSIELPAGRYRFEAKRSGYKSEIIDVDVQQTIMPIEVELACKEKV